MTDIKFIGTTQVELVNSLDESNKISPIQVGENFIEFNFNTLSKDSSDFYHFVITGSNVQVSGTIDSVTTDYQFFSLFSDCSQITDASQLILSAPTAKKFCFANMFIDCSNLTTPPQLQATNLAQWCYSSMFGNCQKLSSAPILSATTLAKYCYFSMFYNCKALTSAPNLPAQSLEDWCYNSMFFNCQNLTSISSNFTAWQPQNATTNWVTGIETEGNFYNDNVAFIYGVDNVPEAWKDYSKMPLTLKSVGNTIVNLYYPTDGRMKINISFDDGSTWSQYNSEDLINLSNEETVSFSGSNGINLNGNLRLRSSGEGKLIAYGNLSSLCDSNYSNSNYRKYFELFRYNSHLIDASNLCLNQSSLGEDHYAFVFRNCTNLTGAPTVFSESLGFRCYRGTFMECSNLTTPPPILPATTLAGQCYMQMFHSCSSLSTAPQLPATTLFGNCYFGMFYNCSSLSTAPALPATGLADGCYQEMFWSCTSLTAAPQLPATTLKDGCYYSMFSRCTSLTSAPQLPATTLAAQCYNYMFSNCANLKSIRVNFTYWDSNATDQWVRLITNSQGVFYKPAALSAEYGDSRIPTNWTVVNM